jgi:hypothetical protein
MDRYAIAATAAMDTISRKGWNGLAFSLGMDVLDREIRAWLDSGADPVEAGEAAARTLYEPNPGPIAVHYEVGPDGEARRLSFTIKCF